MGNAVLQSSTFSYNGNSVSRQGAETEVWEPCTIEGGCPQPVAHQNAEAQMQLLSGALSSMHSPNFLHAVRDTQSDLSALATAACMWSIAGHVGSWISVAGCATGVGCVAWLVLHTYSGYSVAKNCANAVNRG